MRFIILNRSDLVYRDPDLIKFPGDIGRIGVYYLSDKNFVSNGDNFCLHIVLVIDFWLKII